jgi:hypothetical protein
VLGELFILWHEFGNSQSIRGSLSSRDLEALLASSTNLYNEGSPWERGGIIIYRYMLVDFQRRFSIHLQVNFPFLTEG